MTESRKKILIIVDEPALLMSLDFLMKKEGFHVFIARDRVESLTIIKTEKPDLIIIDIMMPNVDGYEVCKFVKESPYYNHIKVIFLTAETDKVDMQRGNESGADGYVEKPFAAKDLVKQVKQII